MINSLAPLSSIPLSAVVEDAGEVIVEVSKATKTVVLGSAPARFGVVLKGSTVVVLGARTDSLGVVAKGTMVAVLYMGPISTSENLGFADVATIDIANHHDLEVSENLGLADVGAASRVVGGLLEDVVTLSSVNAVFGVLGCSLSEVVDFSSNTIILPGFFLTATESFDLTESVQAAMVLYPVVSENVGFVEGLGAVISLGATVEETLSFVTNSSAAVGMLGVYTVFENLGLVDSLEFEGIWNMESADSFGLSSKALEDTIYKLAETLGLEANAVAKLVVGFALREEIAFRDGLVYTALALAEDGFSLEATSPAEARKLILAAESLSFSSSIPRATVSVAAQLLEILALNEISSYSEMLSASESLVLTDQAQLGIKTFLESLEVLTLVDAVSKEIVIVFEASENIVLSEMATFSVIVFFEAIETIAFIGELELEGGTFGAWVVNSETMAASRYESWPMESLATRGGRTFGLTETGLFEMTGDSDDGAEIDAWIQTGLFRGGSQDEKTMPRAYLYAVSDSEMVLRTFSDRRGCRTERYYRVTMGDPTALGNRSVRLTNSRKATSWAIRVENVDGADFDLRGLEAKLVFLSSRA